jgi:3-oxoacyl-[acyl-carrier protein] reductase
VSSSTSSYDLSGSTAIVTGAASGIGQASARLLAQRGARVALLDLNVDAAEQVARELTDAGGTATAFAVDLGDSASIESAVALVLDLYGRVDILVGSGGILGGPFGVLDVDDQTIFDLWNVNVRGYFVLSRLVVQHMVDHHVEGRVVFLSSSSAFRALKSSPHYSTTKAAIVQLGRSLAGEVGTHGIRVNVVSPGPTNTPMNPGGRASLDELMQTPGPLQNLMGRAAEPEEVAEVVAFLCSPASSTITGQVIHTSRGAVV